MDRLFDRYHPSNAYELLVLYISSYLITSNLPHRDIVSITVSSDSFLIEVWNQLRKDCYAIPYSRGTAISSKYDFDVFLFELINKIISYTIVLHRIVQNKQI